jgi:hypothetical protein
MRPLDLADAELGLQFVDAKAAQDSYNLVLGNLIHLWSPAAANHSAQNDSPIPDRYQL